MNWAQVEDRMKFKILHQVEDSNAELNQNRHQTFSMGLGGIPKVDHL